MESYLMLVTAAVLLAVDFSLNKVYQKWQGTSLKAGLRFNALLGLCTAVIFWALDGFSLVFAPFSIIIAVAMSTLAITYNIMGFRIMKSGSMALYTLFLMTGGMTVPYVWGLLFLNEPFSIVKTLGLLVLIAAVTFSVSGNMKLDKKQLLMCIAVFFLNGFVSVLSKTHQIEANYTHVSATGFVMLTGLCKFLMAGWTLFTPKEDAPKTSGKKLVFPLIIGSAAVGGVSYMLQLWGAMDLPATVLYPFITGGSMVCSTLADVLVFREKLSRKLLISVALSFVGTCMFL
jgi:drug/metabolite transporter (DMT)-like permease